MRGKRGEGAVTGEAFVDLIVCFSFIWDGCDGLG